MSSPHPHSPADLALAPVLINIERNLEQVRDSDDLDYALALALNDDSHWYHSAAERADRVRQYAIRSVDLHGWQVTPTQDLTGLAVEHSGYRVSLMLGRQLADYIEHGFPARVQADHPARVQADPPARVQADRPAR
jgi:hypothetical protein